MELKTVESLGFDIESEPVESVVQMHISAQSEYSRTRAELTKSWSHLGEGRLQS